MGVPTFHHIGTFLLLAAWVLLLVTSISSPVINDISLAKVVLTNKSDIRNSSVTFGAFGYCVLDVAPASTDQDYCISSRIGYKPAVVMGDIDGTNFNAVAHSTVDGLTNALVLIPVAAGVGFIAFLIAILPTWVSSLIASLVAIIAFIISLVAMAISFSIFGVIKNNVNRDGSGSHAYYGVGQWLLLAATLALLFGSVITFCSCCTSRNSRKSAKYNGDKYNGNGVATTGRRKWFQRRRY